LSPVNAQFDLGGGRSGGVGYLESGEPGSADGHGDLEAVVLVGLNPAATAVENCCSAAAVVNRSTSSEGRSRKPCTCTA
jgi:hypothetical protein